jgi:F0F1-type ATP synthase assembly protein I
LSTPDPDRTSTPRELPGFTAFVGLGTTIAGTVGVGVGLGIWADDALGTSPLCLIIGLVLGCSAATVSTIVLVRRYL